MRFYLEGKNFINKKGLFYAKFFEFEKFFYPFFFFGSIQPQQTVTRIDYWLMDIDFVNLFENPY